MTAPVFYSDGSLEAVAPGDAYLLGGAEGRHAALVQRRGPGERVDVVDGALRARCVVETVDGERLVLRVRDVAPEPEPSVRLVLVQALAKGGRDELAIEAATEVGADAVVPWQADRSIVRWRAERAAKAHAKWVAAVRAAAKQSRRARVPGVQALTDSAGLAAVIERTVAGGGRAFVLHEEAGEALGAVPLVAGAASGAAEPPAILVVVGPEGGIDPREVEAFEAAGARTVRLGPHVLRSSTAGPVALALLAQRLGRWD